MYSSMQVMLLLLRNLSPVRRRPCHCGPALWLLHSGYIVVTPRATTAAVPSER